MSASLKQATQYLKTGNNAKVVEICKKVLAKRPDFNALRLMGLALFKENQIRDSLAIYELAEKMHPNHPDLTLDKVDTMMRLAESADYKSFTQ